MVFYFLFWITGHLGLSIFKRFLGDNEPFAKPLFVLESVHFFYVCENTSPLHVSFWFNFNDLVEGSLAFAKPGGLGERSNWWIWRVFL